MTKWVSILLMDGEQLICNTCKKLLFKIMDTQKDCKAYIKISSYDVTVELVCCEECHKEITEKEVEKEVE